jgi:hypothetical protein
MVRHSHPVYRFLLSATPFLVLALFSGCNSKAERTPELQQLRDRYDQIKEDMNEAEVIAIFEGYNPAVGDYEREVDPNCKPLKRPSTYSIMFWEKPGTVEGDHFVEVYFDKAGYVVGKHRGALAR